MTLEELKEQLEICIYQRRFEEIESLRYQIFELENNSEEE